MVIGFIATAWALVSAPLERVHVRVPVVLTAAGIVTGVFTHAELAGVLNSTTTTRIAEIILAILLFVDASEVRSGKPFGNNPAIAARLLGLALPLSIAAAVGVGAVLFPGIGVPVLVVIACAVVPIDFAAAESLVRDRRVPKRVRDAINVEGGYNDGIVSPIFTYAIFLAGATAIAHHGSHDLGSAVRSVLLAIAVGAVAGFIVGKLLSASEHRGLTTGPAARVVVVILPVLTYATASFASANGFVAAFVCGIVFRQVRINQRSASEVANTRRAIGDHDRAFLDDVTSLLTMGMWFVFGNVAVLVLASGYLTAWTWVYCALVLTVVRAIPVLLALLGSRRTPTERWLIALLGPRGTTSIVFGLLAFNQLADPDAAASVLGVTVLVVLGSVLIHGLAAIPLVRWIDRDHGRAVNSDTA
nr:cation:proton antiporter [Gordonia sp. SID5947]